MPAEASQPHPPRISGRSAAMPHSSIRRLFNAAKDLEAQGVDVYRLDIGDPDFDLPGRIKSAIHTAIDNNRTHYSPMPGLPELRRSIADHMNQRFSLPGDGVQWDSVVCSQGATQALNACLQLTCDSGDFALLPQVYFPNYMQQLCLAGINPLFYPFNDDFRPQLEGLSGVFTDRLKVMLVNSPSNPTGRVISAASIRALYQFARDHGIWIITDGAYLDFVFGGDYLSPLQVDWEYPPEERRVLGIFSFSKSYAATGLRMGWTVCPNPAVASPLGLMNEPFTGSLTTPLQHGMIAALEEDDVAVRREELRRRRDFAVKILRDSGFAVTEPEGGIFFFIDISSTGMDGDTFADRLLAEEQVAVVPGSGFGLVPSSDPDKPAFVPNDLAQRCIRLCFAAPESRLMEGVHRMAAFIDKHRQTNR